MTLLATVNGHRIYSDGKDCFLWTAGIGFWGFHMSEARARTTAETVSNPNA